MSFNKVFRLFNFILIITLILVSCKKRYEDGPLISFLSPERRIKGNWEVISYEINGVDSFHLYNDSCGCILQFLLKDDGWPGNDDNYLFLRNCTNSEAFIKGHFDFKDKMKNVNIDLSFPESISMSFYLVGTGPFGEGKISTWTITRLKKTELWMNTNFNGQNYSVKCKKY